MYIHLYNLGNGYFLQSVYWFVSTYIIVNLNLAAISVREGSKKKYSLLVGPGY